MYDILSVYLENGLRVIMHKIHHIRTMACEVWIKQGSKYESDDGKENIELSAQHFAS